MRGGLVACVQCVVVVRDAMRRTSADWLRLRGAIAILRRLVAAQLPKHSCCPTPLPAPSPHCANARDPPWLPLHHSPFAALPPSVRPWSPNPLLAAQILSLSPAVGDQPVVDLFADPDHRTTRPTPPVNPLRVAWSAPGRLSLLMPPAHLAEHAVTKFLGENAVGVIARTDEASPAARRLAATAAHFSLRFPPHRENCIGFAGRAQPQPTGVTAYAFFLNKQPSSAGRGGTAPPKLARAPATSIDYGVTQHLAPPPSVAPGQAPCRHSAERDRMGPTRASASCRGPRSATAPKNTS
jgi:hypothetical protein